MHLSLLSRETLPLVTDLMRQLSMQTDPHVAATLYGEGLRKLNLLPNDRYLSISRRELSAPRYRITRCSTWKEHPDPWAEKEKLPLFEAGLLGELIYANEVAVIENLQERVSADDPAYEYLQDMKLLVALPHFDRGESINLGVLLMKEPGAFPFDQLPMMLWQANLWGRATLNLVTQQKLKAAYQRLDRELKVVGEIQKSLLPRELPRIEGVEVAAHYQTSARAGGDYYDFFPLPEGQWGVFIADVSGHGTPAAVMMAITHAIAHSHPEHPLPPGNVLSYINRKLVHRYTRESGTFVTALYGVLNPGARTLTFASAGHPLPRWIRGERSMEVPAETSLPLGLSGDELFSEQAIVLEPGDKVLMYTDGIAEAFGPAGELYGTGRLDAAAMGVGSTAGDVLECVLRDVREFTAGEALTDDQTLLAMVVK